VLPISLAEHALRSSHTFPPRGRPHGITLAGSKLTTRNPG